MRGASRASFPSLREQLTSGTKGDELFAVSGLLDAEHGLRRALSDPGKPAAEKAAITKSLLTGKVAPSTVDLVAAAAEQRWATAGDLADAIEQLAIEATVAGAKSAKALDELEDELFRFGRMVAAEPELRDVLSNPALPADGKQGLISELLSSQATPVALTLISQVVTHPRGRTVSANLELAAGIAAKRRERLIAVVRTATALTPSQERRLAKALADAYGQEVHLNIEIDPDVLGGLSVQIGDELIDGTAASRLAAVRRKLAS
jgi:F-type H+-transporting ATPase subunit delta